jgi:hypothetical protein
VTEGKKAWATWPLPRPKDDPCLVCGEVFVYGLHYIRAPRGIKCTVPGCKSDVFDRCVDKTGKVIATHCVPGGHKIRV